MSKLLLQIESLLVEEHVCICVLISSQSMVQILPPTSKGVTRGPQISAVVILNCIKSSFVKWYLESMLSEGNALVSQAQRESKVSSVHLIRHSKVVTRVMEGSLCTATHFDRTLDFRCSHTNFLVKFGFEFKGELTPLEVTTR